MSLHGLFQVVKPFAMTKLDPMERNAVVKAATELQAAVKNLAQGVRGNCNALPQFYVQAGQQLVVLTQAFVAAVWNLHKAAELISAADLVEEAKEFSVGLLPHLIPVLGMCYRSLRFPLSPPLSLTLTLHHFLPLFLLSHWLVLDASSMWMLEP